MSEEMEPVNPGVTQPEAAPLAIDGRGSTALQDAEAVHGPVRQLVGYRNVCVAAQVAMLFTLFTVFDPLNMKKQDGVIHHDHHQRQLPGVPYSPLAVMTPPPPPPSPPAFTATDVLISLPESVAVAAPGSTEAAAVTATVLASPASVAPSGDTPLPTSSPASGGPLPTLRPHDLELDVYRGKRRFTGQLPLIDPLRPLDAVVAPAFTLERVVRRSDWTEAANAYRAHANATELRQMFPKVLLTEAFSGRYGLNNVLLATAGMLMWGALSDRAVHFPKNSPVPMESLLDLNATEEMLRGANVVILSETEFDSLYTGVRPSRARKIGVSFGYRMLAGSDLRGESEESLRYQRDGARRASKHQVFTHRDFFLSFPSRATSPLDICFFMKRLVYHYNVRSMAHQLLAGLREKGSKTYLAFHLRLEADASLVRKEASLVTAEELQHFLSTDLVPFAERTGVDAIYVCAGKLNNSVMTVLKAKYAKPIYLKTDFPNIRVPMVDEKTVVTSHVGAAVDALLMKHAAVAVALGASTFGFGTLAARCPSPTRRATGDTNDLRHALKQFTWEGEGESALVTPAPGVVKLASTTASGLSDRVPQTPFEGVYFYDYNVEAKFTPMKYAPCDQHERWCYYPD
jgi:hypothetical protein